MGISGLLPLLKDITHKAHIKQFQGKRAAVDGYVWLYKGSYCCPEELCEGRPTDKFVKYCMSMVDLLRHHGVQPVVVLDGDKMPAKAVTEEQRQSSRAANRERGRQLAAAGNTRAAMEMYQRAVEVTPQMARAFMEALATAGVEFIVAPYEADAQMAYLAKNGLVDLVITEDSDLLVYGCPQVLFKLARSGECDHIKIEDLPMNRNPSFVGFSHDNFIEMCILAGCDFVSSLPGMGIKKAHAGVKRFRTFPNVIKSAKLSKVKVPPGYECDVQRAYWTFRHQRVWCPVSRTMVHLNDIPNGNVGDSRMYVPSALPEGTELAFLGAQKPDDISCAVAEGRVDPMTHKPFVVHVVDGIVHVEPPEQDLSHHCARISAPAAYQQHSQIHTQPVDRHNNQTKHMGILHHAIATHGSASRMDCNTWIGKHRSSAPARVQATNSVAPQLTGSSPFTLGCAAQETQSGAICRPAMHSSKAGQAVKGDLKQTQTTMRERLLAALTSRVVPVDFTRSRNGIDCQLAPAPPSSCKIPQAHQVAHPGQAVCSMLKVDTSRSRSSQKASVCLDTKVQAQVEATDNYNMPSQAESGADSALSLLTSSSFSQGQGAELRKVSDHVQTTCAKLQGLQSTRPASFQAPKRAIPTEAAVPKQSVICEETVRCISVQAMASTDVPAVLNSVENLLPHNGPARTSFSPGANIDSEDQSQFISMSELDDTEMSDGAHTKPSVRLNSQALRPPSKPSKKRGSLKDLLQAGKDGGRSRTCSSLSPGNQAQAEQKSVDDLKRCKLALPKAVPFKRPRKELQHL
eukprot:jgi/Ulvmu1/5225/UM022_0018.1